MITDLSSKDLNSSAAGKKLVLTPAERRRRMRHYWPLCMTTSAVSQATENRKSTEGGREITHLWDLKILIEFWLNVDTCRITCDPSLHRSLKNVVLIARRGGDSYDNGAEVRIHSWSNQPLRL